jgi:transposase-like protein
MTGHGSKFGRKKEQAIIALLSQRNIEEAAKSIEVAPNTLLRWLREPGFDAAYREARRSAFAQSVSRLQQASTAAVTTVLKIMVDPLTPASVRLRAADIVLDRTGKAIELEDIEARLAALEQAMQDNRADGVGCATNLEPRRAA